MELSRVPYFDEDQNAVNSWWQRKHYEHVSHTHTNIHILGPEQSAEWQDEDQDDKHGRSIRYPAEHKAKSEDQWVFLPTSRRKQRPSKNTHREIEEIDVASWGDKPLHNMYQKT